MFTFLMNFSDGRSYRIGEWKSIGEFPYFYRAQCIDQIYTQIDRTDSFTTASFVNENQLPGDSVLLDFKGFTHGEPIDWDKPSSEFNI
jgi:hypothetical protein